MAPPEEAPGPAVIYSSLSTHTAEKEPSISTSPITDLGLERCRYELTTKELDTYKLLSKSQMDSLSPSGFTTIKTLLFSRQFVLGLSPFRPLPAERNLAPYKDRLGAAIRPAIQAHFGKRFSLELATAVLLWGMGKLERRISPVLGDNGK